VGVVEEEIMLKYTLVAFPLTLRAMSMTLFDDVVSRSTPEMKGTKTMLLEGVSKAEGYVMLPTADFDVEMLRFMLKK
jgi:hypothetical protein